MASTGPRTRPSEDSSFDDFFHGLLNTEPRIVTYIGIARGQLPAEHYYRINRTLRPASGVEQKQTPHGESRTYLGVAVFEGHYTYQGMRIVPSWGGSMFEALMVPLFVPEARWAPRSWGINHPLYVRAQIAHGLDEAHYGFWGFSPACRPEGGYQTYGVPALGTNPHGYTSQDGPAPVDLRLSGGLGPRCRRAGGRPRRHRQPVLSGWVRQRRCLPEAAKLETFAGFWQSKSINEISLFHETGAPGPRRVSCFP